VNIPAIKLLSMSRKKFQEKPLGGKQATFTEQFDCAKELFCERGLNALSSFANAAVQANPLCATFVFQGIGPIRDFDPEWLVVLGIALAPLAELNPDATVEIISLVD